MAKLLPLLLAGSLCAAGQSVVGSVFDASTGAGVGGVKVELLKGGTAFYEAATDGGGRFRFDNIPEADYAVRYRSPDYWLTAGSSDYKLFHVGGESPVKIEVRLLPWSTISGRVVDRQGNALANAPLELTGSGMMVNGRTYLRTSWGGGGGGQLSESPLAMRFAGKTDAQGKFEVQVMPGSYGLSVRPPAGLKPPEREEDGPALAWKQTYYPGVGSAAEAAKIVVLPGGHVSDVELKLLAVTAHAVRGVVRNGDGTPAVKAAVTLGEGFAGSNSVESGPDGAFEFAAVAEGEWTLVAARPEAGKDRSEWKLRATEWIEVTKHDLENVQLRLSAPLTLRGKAVVEAAGETGKARPDMGPMILAMRRGRGEDLGDLPGMGSLPVMPDSRGEILVEGAYPGVYRLGSLLQPPPAPYYLDAVRVGGADLTTQDVEIRSDASISMVYKADGGSVRGTAENCASGGVLLVPADPSMRKRGFSRAGACDDRDRYEVKGLRPGEYYALGFAGTGPVVAVDDGLLNQAVKVTVKAGEGSTADVRVVTRPVY